MELSIAVPNLGEMWSTVADGARNEARKRGYNLQIYNVDSNIDTDLRIINELPKMAVKGALVVSIHNPKTSKAVINLHQQGFPVVLLDQRLQDIEISSIVFDNYTAGYIAGSKLVNLGHRRIGFVGFAGRNRTSRRLEGLRDAVNDAGIPFDRTLVREIPFECLLHIQSVELEQKIHDLVSHENRPTAIFFHTDSFAAEAYRLIRHSKLRIPQDISIVGCGNSKICRLIDPELATIEFHCEKMGRNAITMLLKLMNGVAVENQTLQAQWIDGKSIGPCNISPDETKHDTQKV
ncbi:MAG: substrate-binding domain-containing protein [Victivallaceae bacterium]|nr:substrate-binding domain-containing protein [Victivallaceae bacterium]